MSVMSDKWIIEMAESQNMIDPFVKEHVSVVENRKILSYGLSSYGYDARISKEFKIFSNVRSQVVDPKDFSEFDVVDHCGDFCIVPPNGFVLAHTIERFKIPRNVLVFCITKSTYARCGITANVTPLEPEWEGTVTLEFANLTPLPVKLYAGEGGCQFIFFSGDRDCLVSYADRKGKYMGQQGVTFAKV
jgi:dCTP deaminase